MEVTSFNSKKKKHTCFYCSSEISYSDYELKLRLKETLGDKECYYYLTCPVCKKENFMKEVFYISGG